ncbi:hypothetical protein Tsubulata_030507 [Turnera subulata]|uniref:Uncharacterized protein n=1 Tax=Turnera subulata TaxID=218843 RepID=A0A9Q0FSJ3_9ROSI|nr:hypothetical protein Tsubulata_030507 [Turnera subulata]
MLSKHTSRTGAILSQSNSESVDNRGKSAAVNSKGNVGNQRMTEYEHHRQLRVAQNKAKIEALGLTRLAVTQQTISKTRSAKRAQELLASASDVASNREPKKRRKRTRSMT